MTTPSAEIVAGKPEQGPFISLDEVVLPASGAFTSQNYTTIPPQSRRLSIVGSYAKAAAAASGSASFRVQWRLASGNGELSDVYETVIDGTTVTKTDPILENPQYAYQVDGPVTTSSINFRVLSLEVPPMADAVRVLAAENTDTVHPGTLTVRLYTSSDL